MVKIKAFRFSLILVPLFVILSAATYLVQIKIFDNPRQTLFYILQDLAFIPVQAVIVSLFIDRLLNMHEKRQKSKKVNVLISSFFMECGTSLIESIIPSNANFSGIIEKYGLSGKDRILHKKLKRSLRDLKIDMVCTESSLIYIRSILLTKKDLILDMLGNPSLLEHDTFTDMLWSAAHLADELMNRKSLTDLPQSDMSHLNNDVSRVYRSLILEWTGYMEYLKAEYPYLFSIAERKNPFSDNDIVVI